MSTLADSFAPPLGVTSPLNACYIRHDRAKEPVAYARCMLARLRERARDTDEWREKVAFYTRMARGEVA